MIAKLFGGPMDGAGYVIVTDQQAPDGLWFNATDEHGRNVQNQYVHNGKIEHVSGNGIGYVYDGQVVETGIEFDTEPSVPAPLERLVSGSECICPVVDIVCKPKQITDGELRQVGELLHAMVRVTIGVGRGTTIFGKHRDDCPCR